PSEAWLERFAAGVTNRSRECDPDTDRLVSARSDAVCAGQGPRRYGLVRHCTRSHRGRGARCAGVARKSHTSSAAARAWVAHKGETFQAKPAKICEQSRLRA